MILKGRNLSLQTRPITGTDVKLLQTELQQLGYLIPAAELGAASFGEFTRQAVVAFQTKEALQTTGIVEAHTAELINARVDALHPPDDKFIVRGQVLHTDGNRLRVVTVKAVDKDMRSEEGSAKQRLIQPITTRSRTLPTRSAEPKSNRRSPCPARSVRTHCSAATPKALIKICAMKSSVAYIFGS